MNNINQYLDLYREFEEALKSAYAGKKTKYSSLTFEYMNGEGKKYFEELDLCRELRNLLSHHSSFDGKDPLYPSDELMNFLRKVINEINNPPAALDIGTPAEKLLTAHPNDRAVHMLAGMRRRGFSHIPILDRGAISGVFSIEAAFLYQTEKGALITDKTLISDLEEYTPISRHMAEDYMFTDASSPLSELKDAFNSKGPGNRRLAAIFVTDNGNAAGKLLSMITPWDVLKKDVD